MNGDSVIDSIKEKTTQDITEGIIKVLNFLSNNRKIEIVLIGTTHFINSYLQKSKEVKIKKRSKLFHHFFLVGKSWSN